MKIHVVIICVMTSITILCRNPEDQDMNFFINFC